MKLNNLRQLIREELAKALNEEMIINRNKLADLLKANGMGDHDNFIRTGNPSQEFLQDMVDQLENKGISTVDIYVKKPKLTHASSKLSPSDFPSKKSKGYMEIGRAHV